MLLFTFIGIQKRILQISITNINDNRPHYVFNDMTNIKTFDPSLLSIDKISFKSTDSVIYDIEYITMKSLDNANSLYLIFNNVDVYIEENIENKYLIFASADKNKEVFENYTGLWDEIKDQIEVIKAINDVKPIKYEKDFMKIKFELNDDLPLGKILSIPVCIVAAGSIFEEYNNYYPQVYLHECLYGYECKDEDDSYPIV